MKVPPQGEVEISLVQRQVERTRQGGTEKGGKADRAKDRVDAFFAKTWRDVSIDVHAEGQLMTRILLNPACGWECTTHPQPTLQDLSDSLECSTLRNVKVLHLAGHGRRDGGFVWNADDAATATMETDIKTLVDIISKASGQNGSIECALLNAWSTKKFGEGLKEAGMSHIVCWKTPVQDETARELCWHFYDALVQQSKDRSQPTRDYQRAFYAATDMIREHSYIGAATRLPGASTAVKGNMTLTKTREDGPNDSAGS